ncbi:MAG TPA: methyltransferase domain-containing protein [Thermoanaerobaculia bacterium]
MPSIDELCRLYAARGLVHHAGRYRFYLDTVFRPIRFEGRRVLDVGSGAGIVSCYAVLKGAAHVVALEPEAAGSTHDAGPKARELFEAMGVASRITMRNETLQTFEDSEPFDVVVLHNSINHLDERACIALRREEQARAAYRAAFGRLADTTKSGGQLFVSDCSPRNAFPTLGLRNPFAPAIDWTKHQPPREWIELLTAAGFTRPALRWTPVNRLYAAGRWLTGNRLASFFTTSHFSLTMLRR